MQFAPKLQGVAKKTNAIVSSEGSSIAKAMQSNDRLEKPYEIRANKPRVLLL